MAGQAVRKSLLCAALIAALPNGAPIPRAASYYSRGKGGKKAHSKNGATARIKRQATTARNIKKRK